MSKREFLFGSIFLLSNRLQALGDTVLKEITLKQWLLLIVIHTMDKDTPSISEVATLMGSTRQNIRKMLELLEKNGYVSIGQNLKDKRNLSVELTKQTLDFFAKFEKSGDDFLVKIFKDVDSQQLEITCKTLEIIFNNIEKMEQRKDEKSHV